MSSVPPSSSSHLPRHSPEEKKEEASTTEEVRSELISTTSNDEEADADIINSASDTMKNTFVSSVNAAKTSAEIMERELLGKLLSERPDLLEGVLAAAAASAEAVTTAAEPAELTPRQDGGQSLDESFNSLRIHRLEVQEEPRQAVVSSSFLTPTVARVHRPRGRAPTPAPLASASIMSPKAQRGKLNLAWNQLKHDLDSAVNEFGGTTETSKEELRSKLLYKFIAYLREECPQVFLLSATATTATATSILSSRSEDDADDNADEREPWMCSVELQQAFASTGSGGYDVYSIAVSGDGNQALVISRKNNDGDNDDEPYHILAIYDRTRGLIGELPFERLLQHPVFGPDFFVAELAFASDFKSTGLQIFIPPSDEGRRGRCPTLCCSVNNLGSVVSAALAGPNAVAVLLDGDHGVCNDTSLKIYPFKIGGGVIRLLPDKCETLTFPEGYDGCSHVAAYIQGESTTGEQKKTFVVVAKYPNTLIVHDIEGKATISRTIEGDGCDDIGLEQGITALACSATGKLVAGFKGSVSILDIANVNSLVDIEAQKPTVFDIDKKSFYKYISFSPDGTKAALIDQWDSTKNPIIDLTTGEVLSEGWDAKAWNILVNN